MTNRVVNCYSLRITVRTPVIIKLLTSVHVSLHARCECKYKDGYAILLDNKQERKNHAPCKDYEMLSELRISIHHIYNYISHIIWSNLDNSSLICRRVLISGIFQISVWRQILSPNEQVVFEVKSNIKSIYKVKSYIVPNSPTSSLRSPAN